MDVDDVRLDSKGRLDVARFFSIWKTSDHRVGWALREGWIPNASLCDVYGGNGERQDSAKIGSLAALLDPSLTPRPKMKYDRNEVGVRYGLKTYSLHIVKLPPSPSSLSPQPSVYTPSSTGEDDFVSDVDRVLGLLQDDDGLKKRRTDLRKLNSESWCKPLLVFLVMKEVNDICGRLAIAPKFGAAGNGGHIVCDWLGEGLSKREKGLFGAAARTFQNWNSCYNKATHWWGVWQNAAPALDNESLRRRYDRLVFWYGFEWKLLAGVQGAMPSFQQNQWLTEKKISLRRFNRLYPLPSSDLD